jgi:outer membrane lipoprotein SlyB
MKSNLNPIYLYENGYIHGNVDVDVDLNDRSAMIAGGALGGIAGNFLSKTLLKNVSDIKKLIASTNNAKECINILQGYTSGATPIASIADKCITICNKYPQIYKGKCLKILNNYNAIGTIIGTAGGAVLGGALGDELY